MIRRQDPLTRQLLFYFALFTAGAAGAVILVLSVYVHKVPETQAASLLWPTAAVAAILAVLAGLLFGTVYFLVLRGLSALVEPDDDPKTKPETLKKRRPGVIQRVAERIRRHETQYSQQVAQLRKEVKERRAAERDAKDALAVQTNFLATTSHELRTPLNAMMGLLHLIQISPDTPPKCKQHARTALSAGQRLLEMVTNTLEAAKLEAKAVTINPNETDIRRVTRHWLVAAEASLHRRSRDGAVAATLKLAPGLEQKYFFDGGRVSQIVGNLTDNASKFTQAGEVEIAVDPIGGGEFGLEIRVRDTGEGIPTDVRDSIFDRFTQGKQGLSRPHDGSGLGLWICADLASLMGGTLELAASPTVPGFTTEFVLRLPLSVRTATGHGTEKAG